MNTLTTLLSISAPLLLPICIKMIKEKFADPALKQVTLHEFGILNTPEGEVYDQSIFERYVILYYIILVIVAAVESIMVYTIIFK